MEETFELMRGDVYLIKFNISEKHKCRYKINKDIKYINYDISNIESLLKAIVIPFMKEYKASVSFIKFIEFKHSNKMYYLIKDTFNTYGISSKLWIKPTKQNSLIWSTLYKLLKKENEVIIMNICKTINLSYNLYISRVYDGYSIEYSLSKDFPKEYDLKMKSISYLYKDTLIHTISYNSYIVFMDGIYYPRYDKTDNIILEDIKKYYINRDNKNIGVYFKIIYLNNSVIYLFNKKKEGYWLVEAKDYNISYSMILNSKEYIKKTKTSNRY